MTMSPTQQAMLETFQQHTHICETLSIILLCRTSQQGKMLYIRKPCPNPSQVAGEVRDFKLLCSQP
jgi:hypothetical protein